MRRYPQNQSCRNLVCWLSSRVPGQQPQGSLLCFGGCLATGRNLCVHGSKGKKGWVGGRMTVGLPAAVFHSFLWEAGSVAVLGILCLLLFLARSYCRVSIRCFSCSSLIGVQLLATWSLYMVLHRYPLTSVSIRTRESPESSTCSSSQSPRGQTHRGREG